MSIMIPETAPFSADQRAWLNGFFAGLMAPPEVADSAPIDPQQLFALLSGQAMASVGAAADGDDGADPWHDQTIALADRMALAEGRPLRRRMYAAMAQQDCGQCGYLCESYADAIAAHAEERLNLCVPGGKDTARMLKALAEEMGAGVIGEAVEAATGKATGTIAPGRGREAPVVAKFLSATRLNKQGLEKETYHIEIDLAESGLEYRVGDSFGICPTNDPELVDRLLATLRLPGDFPVGDKLLRQILIEDCSLAPAPDALFTLISYLTGGEKRQKAKALAKGEDPDGDASTLDVLAAFEKFAGVCPDPEALVEVLEPLQPRLYSISSSLAANPGKVSLTVDKVRYTIADRTRLGVASSFLADRVRPGQSLRVYVQAAHGFGLPCDPATPIIMVGPGTGIAPFRAFLQERLAQKNAGKAVGPAWLFFGHQRRTSDYFYEDELAGFEASGVLTRQSLAFSRDQAEKIYVQDRMREAGQELYDWLSRGAHFYVCGDAKRMAADVDSTLREIIAEYGQIRVEAAKDYLKRLTAEGRYQRDVY